MNNYQNDGVWMKPKRSKKIHLDEYDNEIDYLAIITGKQKPYREEIVEYEVDEGDTENYWTPTAANAIRPLHKLISLAKMRPDCIWDGD